MLKSYLLVIIRNLLRQRFYAGINILGLTIGICSSLIIMLFILDAISYDTFHKDAERIYRINLSGRLNGQDFDGFSTSEPLAPAMREAIPEVEATLRFRLNTNVVLKYEEEAFTEKNLILADSNFFTFFSFKLLEGDPITALVEPNSLVITEALAKRYFDYTPGSEGESPLGKTMLLGTRKRACVVTGIVENTPHNSHFDFDILVSYATYTFDSQWTNNSGFTFIKKTPEADIEEINRKVALIVEKNVGPELADFLKMSFENFKRQGGRYAYFAQPLTEIYLDDYLDKLKPGPSKKQLYLFTLIAIFIVVLACINFMNLATARSVSRAKEVGVRKTLGAEKFKLVLQFLTESMLYSLLSMILALVLCYLLLPLFNQITQRSLHFSMFYETGIVISVIGFVLVVGVLSGSYPAFYLTSFNPTETLKGKVHSGWMGNMVRSTLVVFQFVISITLMISTLFIYKQLVFMRKSNLGFDKTNVLVVDNVRSLGKNRDVFRDKLMQLPQVESVSYSSMIPPFIQNSSVFKSDENAEELLLYCYWVDKSHQKALGLEMVKGRFFDEKFASDSNAVVINQATFDALGWSDIENKKLRSYMNTEKGELREVIGVVKNFNYQSLHNEVRPLAILNSDVALRYMVAIKLKAGRQSMSIPKVKAIWEELSLDAPFDYEFMDASYNDLFKKEKRLGDLFLVFTILSLFIGSLGLLGLATFTAEQRTKEIGIRKAMGASTLSIILLLTHGFTKLILLAFIPSIVAVYLIVNSWLGSFAYKVPIDPLTFGIGCFAALSISWITIALQIYKSAKQNPVASLKTE